MATILPKYGKDKSDLLSILQDIQDSFGYLPRGALYLLSKEIKVPENEIYGVATFYAIFRFEKPAEHKITVCTGTACYANGSGKILDEAERKLTMGGLACNWRPRTRDLFRDIVILMRDTGMRNERELFRMRIENLDWQHRVIFCARQQNRRRTTTGSDERASLRNSADQVRCKTGGLGISIEALRIWASEVNLQSLPKSAQQSRSSERAGSLLCAT
jgi:hypothetical protein